jgi:acetylornithine/N-succinyldiaminopimelate aminotransferase
MAVAKGLGGGFPVGACLATAEAAKGMTLGIHGTTFGGNPLAMTVAKAALDIISRDEFLEHVQRAGLYLKQRLASVVDAHPSIVAEVRGEGLLAGIRCVVPNGEVVTALRDNGVLSAAAGDNVVRLLPPLTVSESEIDEAARRIEAALVEIERAGKPAAKAG